MRKLLISSLALAVRRRTRGRRDGDRRAHTAAAPAAIPGCAIGSLNLIEYGVLTIGTDNPAFPPWFGGAEKTKPWKVSDPYSGKGYESAVAYAVAKQLGFTKAQVKWTVVPVQQLVPPGQEALRLRHQPGLDHDPQRAKAVDFSKSYYDVNQAVVGRKGKPIAKAKCIAALKPYKLGAQVGTTSYTYITKYIKPSQARSSTTPTTPPSRR